LLSSSKGTAKQQCPSFWEGHCLGKLTDLFRLESDCVPCQANRSVETTDFSQLHHRGSSM